MTTQTPKQREFTALFQNNENIVKDLVYKMSWDKSMYRDDMFQDAAYQAWKSFHTFTNNGKPDSFKSWLFVVARNAILQRLQFINKQIQREDYFRNNMFYEIHEEYTEDTIPIAVIEALNTAERITLEYRMSGMSYKDISRITGEEANTLRVRMHRVVKLLKSYKNHISGVKPARPEAKCL